MKQMYISGRVKTHLDFNNNDMIRFVWMLNNWFFQRTLRKKISASHRQRHIYISWKTWSGKSELIKQLIYSEICSATARNAIVLLDPHWDMSKEIARFKEFSNEKTARRLVYIDPSLSTNEYPSINPFAFVDAHEDSINLMAQEIIKILNVLLKWTTTTSQMNAILYPCVATLLRRKDSSLIDLKRFMNDEENSDLIEEWMKLENQLHRRFFTKKFKSKSLWISKHAIEMRLQVLLNDPILQRLLTWAYSIDLESLIQQRKIIIFRLPLGELGSDSVEAYWRFIVALLRVIALKRANRIQSKRIPTYLFIDEFHNFVSPDLEKALTQLRKYKLYLVLASQYIWQCWDKYLQKALLSVWVIIAWQNERKSRKVIEDETAIVSSEIENLKHWEFWVQSSMVRPFKIRVPRFLLNNAHSMPYTLWKHIRKIQLSKYYFKTVLTFEPNRLTKHIDLSGLSPKY